MVLLCCCQPLLPLPQPQTQETAPPMQLVCSSCKIAANSIAHPHHRFIRSAMLVGEVVGESYEKRWYQKS
eukprot:4810054-Ditylum_brightwellii.AAC.1